MYTPGFNHYVATRGVHKRFGYAATHLGRIEDILLIIHDSQKYL